MLAHYLDGVLGFGLAEGEKLLAAGVLIGEESLCKRPVLNLGQNFFTRFSRIFRAREAIDKKLRPIFDGGLGRPEDT